MKENLKICTLYLEDVSNIGSCIVDEHKQKRKKSDIGAVIALKGGKIQVTLNIPRLSKQKQGQNHKICGHDIIQNKALF